MFFHEIANRSKGGQRHFVSNTPLMSAHGSVHLSKGGIKTLRVGGIKTLRVTG